MKVPKNAPKLLAAEAASAVLAAAAGHRLTDWIQFSEVRAFTTCRQRGCNLAFSLDLTGLFGQQKGPLPSCPYVGRTRRTWQLGVGPSIPPAGSSI